MEMHGILDITNPVHVYALHFVYLPKINEKCSEYMNTHNFHSISTEHNRTPLYLYTSFDHATTSRTRDQDSNIGFINTSEDWASLDRERERVRIDAIGQLLSDDQILQLQDVLLPFDDVNDIDGVHAYESIVQWLLSNI